MEPIFILPFDHRANFAVALLKSTYPAPKKTVVQIKQLKKIVFDGFLQARKTYKGTGMLGILVDEEFGSDIIKQAQKHQIPFAVSTEKSGQKLYQFEHESNWQEVLRTLRPTFAKTLVRYDIAEKKENLEQNKRLKHLSDFCEEEGIDLMMEVLMTGKGSREKQMATMMQEMQRIGIRPSVWKLEGLDSSAAWKRIRKITSCPIIVLGRAGTKKEVDAWLIAGAKSGVTNGLAVGRTIFQKPLQDLIAKKIDRETAVGRIAKNYLGYIKTYEKAST